MFTTLSPCDICAALIYRRQFSRLLVGDITNFSGTEDMIREKGVHVDILEDPEGIALFAKYLKERPDQHLEDAYGLAAVRKAATAKT
jgi:cytosine deaminase